VVIRPQLIQLYILYFRLNYADFGSPISEISVFDAVFVFKLPGGPLD
jgi:hypothetical protein